VAVYFGYHLKKIYPTAAALISCHTHARARAHTHTHTRKTRTSNPSDFNLFKTELLSAVVHNYVQLFRTECVIFKTIQWPTLDTHLSCGNAL